MEKNILLITRQNKMGNQKETEIRSIEWKVNLNPELAYENRFKE